MARRNTVTVSLPSLENGVSQQAGVARSKSQGSEQINMLSDLAKGLTTRPPTKHIARIRNAITSGNAHVHTINRDESEQYAVMLFNGGIEVYDLNTGTQKTVSTPDGVSYLANSSPEQGFALTTVIDNTWVVNKSITPALDASITPDAEPQDTALVYVKRAMYGHTYNLRIELLDGVRAWDIVVEAPELQAGYPAECSGEDIVDSFVHEFQRTYASDTDDGVDTQSYYLSSYFTCEKKGSLLKITRTSGTNFGFSVSDSYANQGLVGIKGAIQAFEDLPAVCFNGIKVKVTGSDKTKNNDYYVEYRTDSDTQTGVWVETYGWGEYNDINQATMPHQLLRESDGTFTFQAVDWASRKVGDSDTAAEPAFIGRKISDVVFHLNRLGFICEDHVMFSRDNEYNNFWPRKATDSLADDPVELVASGSGVSDLDFAVPYNKSLLLQSRNKQFQTSSDGPLTPESGKILETTSYGASPKARPTLAGNTMFFVSDNGDYSIVREYYVSEEAVVNVAGEITRHIPSYIPDNISQIIAHSNNDMIFVLSKDTPHILYVYMYYWGGQNGNEKVQSSWSKFEFPAGSEILKVDFLDNKACMLVNRSDGIYLEQMTFYSDDISEGMEFSPALDRQYNITGSYDSETDITTFTLPYPVPTDVDIGVVLGGDFTGAAGKELTGLSRPSTTTVTIAGDYSASSVFVGIPYYTYYEFSPQYVRNERAEGSPAYTDGRTQILRMSIDYDKSGAFNATVTSQGETTEYSKLGVLGSAALIIGKPVIDTGTFTFPVTARNTNVAIALESISTIPISIQKAEWSGYYASN